MNKQIPASAGAEVIRLSVIREGKRLFSDAGHMRVVELEREIIHFLRGMDTGTCLSMLAIAEFMQQTHPRRNSSSTQRSTS
jgi:hypothetical protein